MMNNQQSIRSRLPLLLSALLCVVVTAVCSIAYVKVEKVLVNAADDHVTGVAKQIANLLNESAARLRHDSDELAQSQALLAFLQEPGKRTEQHAVALLRERKGNSTQLVSYTLLSRRGERLLHIGPAPTNAAADAWPGRAFLRGRSTVFSGLAVTDSSVTYRTATPVLDASQESVGMLVSERHVTTAASMVQLRALMGADVSLLLGNASGDSWTDLVHAAAGPPGDVAAGEAVVTRIARVAVHGTLFAIPATPWVVWVHMTHATVVSHARGFVLSIAVIGVVLVVVGTMVAVALCDQVTAPLMEVSQAAQDLANGDYDRRVKATRRDELGRLATSFNTMAARVQISSAALEAHAKALEAANTALRSGEQRFRGLIEAAHDGICAVDTAGIITYANQRFAQIVGQEASQLAGTSLFGFMDPSVAAEAQEQFTRQLCDGVHKSEVPMRRSNGETVWVSESISPLKDADGVFAGALFLLSDIMERRAALELRRARERHFRALIENASDMICVVGPDGLLGYVSPANQRFIGYSPAELTGKNVFDFIHPDDVLRTQASFSQALESPGASIELRFRHQHKTGTWRELAATATNLLADTDVGGVVVNSHDVTDEHALSLQLLQSQKMEAVGQLAGGIAHDFNNLLTVMTSYSGMLLQELPVDNSVRSDILEIQRAAERASELTRQLLAFSRQQVLQPEVVDVSAVVRDVERMLSRLMREDVQLVTSFGAHGKVHADIGQLEQVIVNLAVNARDAMPTGGTLTIATSEVELDGEYARSHVDVTHGKYVMIAVSDTGLGMDKVTQSKIFEPFFTTKPVGEGTGLGLATVHGIVKQSGGHIWVYSEEGIGTTIKVYFPRHSSGAPESGVVPTPPEIHIGTGTVLLVEDEPQVRQAARRILEGAGYLVLEASNGADALRLSRDHQGDIDLLLTDMVMPNMSGSELAMQFRELRPTTATAYMSGYTEDAMLRRIVFTHSTIFIEKPFTPEALTRKVRQALAA